jgi:hypothetical protein
MIRFVLTDAHWAQIELLCLGDLLPTNWTVQKWKNPV